jgi:hypothetical protein
MEANFILLSTKKGYTFFFTYRREQGIERISLGKCSMQEVASGLLHIMYRTACKKRRQ